MMATRGPQNVQQGLERGVPLGFWATFTKFVFWSEHSFYEKVCDGEVNEKSGKETNIRNSVLLSLWYLVVCLWIFLFIELLKKNERWKWPHPPTHFMFVIIFLFLNLSLRGILLWLVPHKKIEEFLNITLY